MAIGSGLIGLVILVLDIWAILTILRSGESPGAKLVWILLVVILPLIGLIIWLIAGSRGGRMSPR